MILRMFLPWIALIFFWLWLTSFFYPTARGKVKIRNVVQDKDGLHERVMDASQMPLVAPTRLMMQDDSLDKVVYHMTDGRKILYERVTDARGQVE